MKFKEEKFNDFIKEAIPLMLANNHEIDLFKEKLDLDFQAYYDLEKAGSTIAFTARTDEGKLIGYCIFLLYSHLHHRTKLVASQDVIYVDPAYRTCGLKLLRYTETELKALGVNYILQSAPKISRLGKVLERLGYEELETLYIRRV